MGTRRRFVVLVIPVCAALAASCGDDGTDNESAAPEQVQTAPTDAQAGGAAPDLGVKDSGVEGVPVPESATAAGGELWTVPDVSYLELVAWYEERMPEGADFGRWGWCDTGGGEGVSAGESNHAHIYSRGARGILAVAVTNDDPPGIVIGADKSGPC